MVNTDRYASIKNVFKRDRDIGRIIHGDFSLPEFEYLQVCKWIFTEKMDGMNIRVLLDGNLISFRGRSNTAHLPGPLRTHLRDTFDVENIRDEFTPYGESLCLYGEGMGAGIQKGTKYGPNQFFTLFDVMTEYGWATRRDVVDLATHLRVPVVPVVLEGTLADAIKFVELGVKSVHGDFFAGGLVGKPDLELRDRYGGRIICKIKHRDFYLGG